MLFWRSMPPQAELTGKVLARLQPLLEWAEAAPAESPQREAVLAALNGVMGDRLIVTASCPCTARWVSMTTHSAIWASKNQRSGLPTA